MRYNRTTDGTQTDIERIQNMLVVTRKLGEQIQIGDDIQLTVTQINGDRIRLGISAPREIPVVRRELIPVETPQFIEMVPE